MLLRPQHRALLVHTRIHNKEIIVLGEHVLVNQMHPPLLRRRADLLTTLDKASIRLLLFSSPRRLKRIVVLGDMEAEEMLCGKVLLAFGAAVAVDLGVVNFEVGEGGEGEGVVVRWEGAFHYCSSGWAVVCRGLHVLGGVGRAVVWDGGGGA